MMGEDLNSPEAQMYKAQIKKKIDELNEEVEGMKQRDVAADVLSKKLSMLSEHMIYLFPFEQNNMVAQQAVIAKALSIAEEAITVSPTTAVAHQQKGQALSMKAFTLTKRDEAEAMFTAATVCVKRACELEPNNENYKMFLQQCNSCMAVWDQVKEQERIVAAAQGRGGGAGGSSSGASASTEAPPQPKQPKKPETLGEKAQRRHAFRHNLVAMGIVGVGAYLVFKWAWKGPSMEKPALDNLWSSKK